MIEPQYPSATRHQYRFEDLSPDDFERLVYQLVKRCGEFDEVEWYGGTRDRGRDVVAYKQTAAGRRKWYFQCKPYVRVTYDIVRNDLDKLAQHTAEQPDFAPDVIIFATACSVSEQVTDQAAVYANQLELPEPYFWDRGALDRMLKSQPETEREFFGLARFLRRHATGFVVRTPCGCRIGVGLFVILLVAAGVILSRRAASPLEKPTPSRTSTPRVAAYTPTPTPYTPTHTPTPIPYTPTHTPTSTPHSSTDTPTATPYRPTDTPTPAPTPRPTRTPTPTPTFVFVQPTLLEPLSGTTIRSGTVFRWEGNLGFGQSFVVRFRHVKSGWVWDIGPLRTNCWEVTLPAERFGGWHWQVRVVWGETTLRESEEGQFWLDPFPRYPLPVLPTPRPCSE